METLKREAEALALLERCQASPEPASAVRFLRGRFLFAFAEMHPLHCPYSAASRSLGGFLSGVCKCGTGFVTWPVSQMASRTVHSSWEYNQRGEISG